MSSEAAQKPASMTDVEWEALNDDEGGPNPDDVSVVSEADDSVDDDNLTEEQLQAKAIEDEQAAAALALEQKKQEAPAPLLVVDTPDDTEAKMAEIATKKGDLIAKLEDGEISVKEYEQERDTLAKEERDIERAQYKAELAADLNNQQARNNFLAEVDTFTKNTLYTKSAAAWNALDAAVIAIGKDPESASLSAKAILEKAHVQVMTDPVFASVFQSAKPDAKTEDGKDKTPIKHAAPPPTLGKLPSAEAVDTQGDRFAALDRLLNTNPIEYEKAVKKLSEADAEAWLSR